MTCILWVDGKNSSWSNKKFFASAEREVKYLASNEDPHLHVLTSQSLYLLSSTVLAAKFYWCNYVSALSLILLRDGNTFGKIVWQRGRMQVWVASKNSRFLHHSCPRIIHNVSAGLQIFGKLSLAAKSHWLESVVAETDMSLSSLLSHLSFRKSTWDSRQSIITPIASAFRFGTMLPLATAV